jgi:hypothetical protein
MYEVHYDTNCYNTGLLINEYQKTIYSLELYAEQELTDSEWECLRLYGILNTGTPNDRLAPDVQPNA